MPIHHSLTINELTLSLFLGWPDDERLRQQTILLSINICYAALPKACATDHLDDTVCYRQLIETLRATFNDKKFHLIEHLAEKIYSLLQTILPTDTNINISLTKQPQIEGLGSVTFHYGDNPQL